MLAVAGVLEVEELWTEDLAPQFEPRCIIVPAAAAPAPGSPVDSTTALAASPSAESATLRSVPVERRRELLIPQTACRCPHGTTS